MQVYVQIGCWDTWTYKLNNPFVVINSEIGYRGRLFDVRRDLVQLPDGQTTQLDIVTHNGAVTIVPVDDDGRIWFVRQYRHAIERELLELPAGTLEAGEAPELAAQRETREEIGMAVETLENIGTFFMAPGYSTEMMHVFLGSGLQSAPLEGDADEFLTVEQLTIEEVYARVSAGRLFDGKTLAALHMARPRLLGGQ
jgi:ADP-ribose pyrophosphatase